MSESTFISLALVVFYYSYCLMGCAVFWLSFELASSIQSECLLKNIRIINRLSILQQPFHISRSTYQEFNKQLVAMVSCLWNSKFFIPGMAIEINEQLLIQSKVPDHWSCYDLVHHPAFFKYAIEFHQKVSLHLQI